MHVPDRLARKTFSRMTEADGRAIPVRWARCRGTIARYDLSVARSGIGIPVQGQVQLRPRPDAELGERPVEMRAHGTVRQVQVFPDLPVGQPPFGQLGDLQLLSRQLRPGIWLVLLDPSAGDGTSAGS
jgi:hypothetical protein